MSYNHDKGDSTNSLRRNKILSKIRTKKLEERVDGSENVGGWWVRVGI